MEEDRRATVTDMIEALGLLEEATFSRRFHEAVGRHPDPEMREHLKEVPEILTESALAKRLGARVWERTTTAPMDEHFLRTAERMLLQTFLHLAEADIRITSAVARHAPTEEVRTHFDAAAGVERRATEILRAAAERTSEPHREDVTPVSNQPLRCATGETPDDDLRGHIEGTIRHLRALGREPQTLYVSHSAIRRLEDQGALPDGKTTLLGVPVIVDLGWDAREYSIQTYESVPLEEMRGEQAAATGREPSGNLE